MTRREMLAGLGAVLARPSFGFDAQAPTAPVAIARCASYGSELLPTLARMFDQLGGLGRLVAGKTVAVKLNLTGRGIFRMGMHRWSLPSGRTGA